MKLLLTDIGASLASEGFITGVFPKITKVGIPDDESHGVWCRFYSADYLVTILQKMFILDKYIEINFNEVIVEDSFIGKYPFAEGKSPDDVFGFSSEGATTGRFKAGKRDRAESMFGKLDIKIPEIKFDMSSLEESLRKITDDMRKDMVDMMGIEARYLSTAPVLYPKKNFMLDLGIGKDDKDND